MNRSDFLDAAKQCITVDRAATHGGAEDSFGDIANMWSTYLGHHVSKEDVCMMMVLLKTVRFKNTPMHADHAVDICGYAAIAGELGIGGRYGVSEEVEKQHRD